MWDVPPEEILEGAAAEGVSIHDYIERHFGLPPIEEVVAKILSREPVKVSGADLIREAREERDARLDEIWSSSTPRQ